jgi:hypothetical protein
VVLFLTGCESPPPAGHDSLAWVEISGRTGPEIRQAAIEVFTENGFHLKTTSVAEATFEKPGSTIGPTSGG